MLTDVITCFWRFYLLYCLPFFSFDDITLWLLLIFACLMVFNFVKFQTVVLKVGMSCGGCVGAVKRVLGKMEGLFLSLQSFSLWNFADCAVFLAQHTQN